MKSLSATDVIPQHKAPTRNTRSGARVDEPPFDFFEVSDWCESEVPAPGVRRDQAFHLLARWLVSAVRKGAPGADSTPVEGSQKRLDVARGAKVGSDGP